jgi:hypothetical protein
MAPEGRQLRNSPPDEPNHQLLEAIPTTWSQLLCGEEDGTVNILNDLTRGTLQGSDAYYMDDETWRDQIHEGYHFQGEHIAHHGKKLQEHKVGWAQLEATHQQSLPISWADMDDQEQLDEQGDFPATGHIVEGDPTEQEPTPEAVASLAGMN